MPTDLEAAIMQKIKPLLEDAMQRYLGITISEIESDITDRLRNPLLEFAIDTKIPFKKAKRAFRKAYLLHLLQLRGGNVSDTAKAAGMARESVQRLIKQFKLGDERAPSRSTRFPLLSISSCCKYAGKRCRRCVYGNTT